MEEINSDNLLSYVSNNVSRVNHPDNNIILGFSLKQKIDFLKGIPTRHSKNTYSIPISVIDDELWELLEDIRTGNLTSFLMTNPL